ASRATPCTSPPLAEALPATSAGYRATMTSLGVRKSHDHREVFLRFNHHRSSFRITVSKFRFRSSLSTNPDQYHSSKQLQ
ncbi:hypothetical protein PanWU01x14_081030, partial [Parasponia andersonii]